MVLVGPCLALLGPLLASQGSESTPSICGNPDPTIFDQKIIKIEKQISRLEKEIKAIDFELEINYEQTIAQPNFFDSYQEKKKQLELLLEKWETLQL